MSTDNREDYLINILRLTEGKDVVKTTELARFMNVSPASVTEMLKVLQSEGLVNYRRYKGVSLTDLGNKNARELRKKHHITESFLTDVLDISHDDAHEQAHAIEHSLSDDAANRMCRVAGAKYDEDCSTCKNPCEKATGDNCVSAADIEVGWKGKISHLSSEDGNAVRKLISMGLVPGREIELVSVVSGEGARVLKVGDMTVALDKEIAKAVRLSTV